MKRRFVALAVLAAALVVAVPAALAAPITVTTLADELNADGDCSLREAIEAANTNTIVDACGAGDPGADLITFGVSGTIALGSAGQLTITDDLTIAGPGAASLTIHGNGFDAGRIMEVGAGVQLGLFDVTIRGGRWISPPMIAGAGILNHGLLFVTNVAFSQNDAGGFCCSGLPGGAIGNDGGTVEVTGSSFTGNSAGGEGGAIYSNGDLTVVNSTFLGNSTNNWGGGIFAAGSGLGVVSSTFLRNSDVFGGGGIATMAIHTEVAGVTFSRNTSSFAGGAGIWHHGGVLNVENSTFFRNSAPTSFSEGGGLLNSGGGSVVVTNATFSENEAGIGNDIHNRDGIVTLRNSIVANSSPSGGNCGGVVLDGGSNLSWPDTTCPGLNQDPLLDPVGLQDNGGPTETIALMPGSPAIDFALVCPPPVEDQRGVPRPQGPACDSGAYEREATVVPRVPQHFQSYDVNEPESVTETVTLVDQFGARTVRLEEIDWLLNPVEKRRTGKEPVPIERPEEHFTCYEISYMSSPARTVHVRNQFVGDSTLRIGRPLALCTPAAKTLTGTPGAPPSDLDHFECYDVTSESPIFTSETLTVVDEFGTRTVRLDRARELCNPVEKRRAGMAPEPIKRPAEHYVCYRIVSHSPAFSARTVFTRDQFNLDSLRVVSPRRVCVPSEKLEGAPTS